MRKLCALALLAALAAITPAQSWRFVVEGDGRSDANSHRPGDKDGVNWEITNELAHAIAKQNPKFVMFTGDLVAGYTKTPQEFQTQLTTWLQAMKPIYDRHIPVLAVRGNHDAGAAGSTQVWQKVFSGKYTMPLNGPSGEKDLTYSYALHNVLILGLDEYSVGQEAVNQAWVDKVLARNHHPLIFAEGHEAAFMDGTHKDTLDANPAKRDAFWESLIKAGSRVFFCGHDHLYDHMTVTRDSAHPGPIMHQIVAGTAGAPFYTKGDYTGNNTGWKLHRVKHIDHTYGYVLVEINGNKATITFMGRTSPNHYAPMDTFSYTAD